MSKKKEPMLSMSFKVTSGLYNKLDEKIIADGYGMRGKSRWIKEAIENLFKIPNYSDLVDLTDSMDDKVDKTVTVRMSRSLMQELEQRVLETRKKYLNLEGIKSKIIRTAILQRFIRQ